MSIVAIVGRPNVGKSTLFNRFIQEKRSIIQKEPGITRDRLYGIVDWNGTKFNIIDTGGFNNELNNYLQKDINDQVQSAIKESHLVLFVVDAHTGILPLDLEFANILRKMKKKVIVVSNKSDFFSSDFSHTEFFSLGFETIYPISAINGYGTGDLLDEILKYLPNEEPSLSQSVLPRFSILGKPNVGKSTFLNAILKNKRTITSDQPGTTRDAIDSYYNLYNKEFIITDTAGIRKKSKIKEDIEFYSILRALKAIDRSDVCFFIIDATKGVESQDLSILGRITEQNKGVLILINKWDLVKSEYASTQEYKDILSNKIKFYKYIPIVFISAINKIRIYKALEKGLEVFKERGKKTLTSQLNATLLDIIKNNPPPATKGKYIKIKYITQLPLKYPAFAFFCNLPQYIKNNYKQFLENQIRKHYGYGGVPITIFFRKK